MRARDWLRSFEIPYRDAVLLEHGDAVICETAREDGVELTCPGDIARERDAAVCRLCDEYETARLDEPVPYPGPRGTRALESAVVHRRHGS